MKAYELLSEPGRWTKGAFARSKTGRMVGELSQKASCWCIYGALIKCYPDESTRMIATQRLSKSIANEHGIMAWNDDPNRTHAEVLAALRKADV